MSRLIHLPLISNLFLLFGISFFPIQTIAGLVETASAAQAASLDQIAKLEEKIKKLEERKKIICKGERRKTEPCRDIRRVLQSDKYRLFVLKSERKDLDATKVGMMGDAVTAGATKACPGCLRAVGGKVASMGVNSYVGEQGAKWTLSRTAGWVSEQATWVRNQIPDSWARVYRDLNPFQSKPAYALGPGFEKFSKSSVEKCENPKGLSKEEANQCLQGALDICRSSKQMANLAASCGQLEANINQEALQSQAENNDYLEELKKGGKQNDPYDYSHFDQ